MKLNWTVEERDIVIEHAKEIMGHDPHNKLSWKEILSRAQSILPANRWRVKDALSWSKGGDVLLILKALGATKGLTRDGQAYDAHRPKQEVVMTRLPSLPSPPPTLPPLMPMPPATKDLANIPFEELWAEIGRRLVPVKIKQDIIGGSSLLEVQPPPPHTPTFRLKVGIVGIQEEQFTHLQEKIVKIADYFDLWYQDHLGTATVLPSRQVPKDLQVILIVTDSFNELTFAETMCGCEPKDVYHITHGMNEMTQRLFDLYSQEKSKRAEACVNEL